MEDRIHDEWEHQIERLWNTFDDQDATSFLTEMRALSASRGSSDANGIFELASASDSTGHEADAVPPA